MTLSPDPDDAGGGTDQLSTTATIQIRLNGEDRSLPTCTVAALLDHLSLDTRKVAVERNKTIVPRSLYSQTALADRDQIEIVHFIGGG